MRLGDFDALKEDLFIKFGNQLPKGLFDEIDKAQTVITNGEYEALCKITDQEYEHTSGFWVKTPKGKDIYFEKVRPKNEWISKTERLPEEEHNPITNDFVEVLCTTIWGDVRVYKYGKPLGHEQAHFWYGFEIMDNEVIAWQPLPKPYKDPLDHSFEDVQCKAEKCSPEGCKHCEGYEPVEFGGDKE